MTLTKKKVGARRRSHAFALLPWSAGGPHGRTTSALVCVLGRCILGLQAWTRRQSSVPMSCLSPELPLISLRAHLLTVSLSLSY